MAEGKMDFYLSRIHQSLVKLACVAIRSVQQRLDLVQLLLTVRHLCLLIE